MNNTGILSKCIEELKKDDFRKDYVLGMLETLVAMEPTRIFTHPKDIDVNKVIDEHLGKPVDDEATILDARARAAIATVQDIAAQSSHE